MKKYYMSYGVDYLRVVLLFLVIFSLAGCEKWSETAEVSHDSYLPKFEIFDGDFQSFVVSESDEYEDPGVIAYEDELELLVYSSGTVDLTEVGVYIITYSATNSDGLSSTAERVVAVTYKDVSGRDLSEKYEGTIWDPLVEMKVTKTHKDGYYKCTDIMGFDGSEMPGKFVDLGNSELYLIHGEGDFGAYASSEGEYSLSTLSWTVSLLEEPYNNTSIPVLWQIISD